MENYGPKIGRIVTYKANDGEERPAIITHVWSVTMVNLQVFQKHDTDRADCFGLKTSVCYGPDCALGTWYR